MKNKPIKARRMWANYYPEATICWPTKRKALIRSGPSRRHRAIPVAVIPLDNPEALVARAAEAFYELEHEGYCERRRVDYSYMRAALTAIGVLPKSKGGRK